MQARTRTTRRSFGETGAAARGKQRKADFKARRTPRVVADGTVCNADSVLGFYFVFNLWTQLSSSKWPLSVILMLVKLLQYTLVVLVLHLISYNATSTSTSTAGF